MKTIWKVLVEILCGIGVLFVAIVVGQILYMAIGDLFAVSMDRSKDAAMGAGMAFAVVVILIYVPWRIFRRKKAVPAV